MSPIDLAKRIFPFTSSSHPTNMHIHLRRSVRPVSLLGVAALAAGVGLLTPVPASARADRRVHVVAHKSTAHGRCAQNRRKSSSRGHVSGGCANGPAVKRGNPRAKKLSKRFKSRVLAEGVPPNSPIGALPASAPPGPSQGPTPPTPPTEPPAEPPAESSPPNEPGNLPGDSGEVVTDPIDSRFLTDAPFGTSSFWIQPWRAYLDTWPASRLLDSLGINFNVGTAKAEYTAQLLHDSGFTLARREIGWGALSYSEPTKFLDESRIRTVLSALHDHGLRPLILLNANSGNPGPATHLVLETISAAPAGAQTVTLTAASTAAVVPGKTGFDGLSFGGDPDILITSVGAGDVASLSKPLPSALAAGKHLGTTLLYAPFGPPTLSDGRPNPAFQATLAGWLSYVATVCKEAASIVGPEGYDLEIWNELGFGSQFLNSEHYYSPGTEQVGSGNGPEPEDSSEPEDNSEPEYGTEAEEPEESEDSSGVMGKGRVTKAVIKALLDETVAYVRNPANGISPSVGITDGFASQSPFPSGVGGPVGLTALSKHPYVSQQSYPADYSFKNIVPLNALGGRDILKNSQTPLFTPTYESLFPEITLTATHTETLIRDIAPFTTNIYDYPHGRNVAPPGGNPVQEWVTEYNLSTGKAPIMGPDEVTPQTGSPATLTPADKAHFHAKVALRSLVADVSKGIGREYFYAAAPGGFSLIGENFFSALESHPDAYPGDGLGGETMTGLHNMLAQFQGPGPNGAPTQLKLLSIAQDGNHAQFTGDGTTAHPDLYDRDVLAVFPFQSSPTRFVIPVYVMTRNLLTLYDPNAPQNDITRFDLPNQTFKITLSNLPQTTNPPTISAYDPLHNTTTPAQLTSRQGNTATIEIAATDYPRTLTINYTDK
jgi:hypothetical protein